MSSSTKETICFVCGHPITTNGECFSMGSDGYRHKKCGPTSKAWAAKFPNGNTEIRRMLEKKPRPVRTKEPTDLIAQAIKEFCGRDKYMRYMDTVNKSDIHWLIESEIGGVHITSSHASNPIKPEDIHATLNAK